MKALLTLLALVSMQTVSAQDISAIKSGDVSLTQAHARIFQVSEICPAVPGRPTCMAYGSRIVLEVTLNGCLDRLAGHFKSFEVIDGVGVISFAGVNVGTKASQTARCVKAPTEQISLTVPFKGEFELVNLDFASSK